MKQVCVLAGVFCFCACATCPPSQSNGVVDDLSGHDEGQFENAEFWSRQFEDPTRDSWQKPELVIEKLVVPTGGSVADIGSATGYFPIRLASRFSEASVWGVDIEPNMVRFLNKRAINEGFKNMYAVLGTPTDPLLPTKMDAVLIVNTVHHIEDRPAYATRLRGYMKSGGTLVIVDFKKGKIPVGPPDAEKLEPQIVNTEFAAGGFLPTQTDEDSLPYQYIVVMKAP